MSSLTYNDLVLKKRCLTLEGSCENKKNTIKRDFKKKGIEIAKKKKKCRILTTVNVVLILIYHLILNIQECDNAYVHPQIPSAKIKKGYKCL